MVIIIPVYEQKEIKKIQGKITNKVSDGVSNLFKSVELWILSIVLILMFVFYYALGDYGETIVTLNLRRKTWWVWGLLLILLLVRLIMKAIKPDKNPSRQLRNNRIILFILFGSFISLIIWLTIDPQIPSSMIISAVTFWEAIGIGAFGAWLMELGVPILAVIVIMAMMFWGAKK